MLTGPEAITFAEVGEHLGAVAGLPAQYVDVPDEAARDELRRSGMPDWMADGIVGLLEQLRAGANAQATDVVRIRTGRDPRSLAEFLRDNS